MATRERLRTQGMRIGAELLANAGREVRQLRRAAGLSQAQLATAIGRSRQFVSRLELGHLRGDAGLIVLAATYAVLGHRLTLKAFPVGQPLRDAAQLGLLARFEGRLASIWRRARESVMPIAGDLRAWDLRLIGPATIGVEAVTALADLQAIQRSMQAKQRDSHVQFVILLVSNTHRNRQMLATHRAILRQHFPLDTREVLRALAAGRSPGGSGIVVL
jgi:transcriptional regulator with XRE-family HTH domain